MDTSGLHHLARFFLTILYCALLSLSLITVLSSTAFCYDLTILTENSGENNYLDSNGQIKGFNTDIVREIMQRLNLNFTIEIVPWKRGYHEVLHRPNVVLFSMVRTFEREKLFKWVGPLNVTKFSFFKKKGSDITINTLDDAKKVGAIGCIGDDVREKLLKRLGFTNLSSLFGKDANVRNVEMLMLGRIDLWISTDHIVFKTANDTGIDPNEIEETLTVKKSYVYLAFSKDTDDKIVNEWQHTLESMKKDGTYKRILSQYPTGLKRITFDPPNNAQPE
jgi:polar amino acid transport system substrate-binding protein